MEDESCNKCCQQTKLAENENRIIPIETDFEPQVLAQMRAELVRYPDKCHYDQTRKKIVYHTDRYALDAYLALQREEIERHKWLESEKSNCDLGLQAMSDWISRFSDKFARYWRQTHVYIPPSNSSKTD